MDGTHGSAITNLLQSGQIDLAAGFDVGVPLAEVVSTFRSAHYRGCRPGDPQGLQRRLRFAAGARRTRGCARCGRLTQARRGPHGRRGPGGSAPAQAPRLSKQDKRAPPAPDLVGRNFTAVRPRIKMVGDITCLPTRQGWLYLASVIDLCTRRLVGYAMTDHMRAELVFGAIKMAATPSQLAGGAIFHSDRGGEYTSKMFRDVLTDLDLRASMGRVGSCFDNAVAES
jgi:transposase InsO family protein